MRFGRKDSSVVLESFLLAAALLSCLLNCPTPAHAQDPDTTPQTFVSATTSEGHQDTRSGRDPRGLQHARDGSPNDHRHAPDEADHDG